MKKTIVFISLLFIISDIHAQYDHQNITLLGHFNDTTVTAEPVYGIRYQSCWGWVDPISSREYGIIGTTSGTYIIEVTNPSTPVVRDYIPGKSTNRIWHEYKTYGNYLYIIADGGNNTLQIADLSYLPDSVHLLHDTTSIFESAHTLYIDGNRMYVASVSTATGGYSAMNVYSLANPETPVLLRRLDEDYPFISQVHDMYVINDTVYASCGYDGLFIFRYDEPSNRFIQLGSLTTYPDQGYNHSSFLSTDHNILYMTDEVPDGMAVKVIDVSTISSPFVVDTFYSNPGATPHNPYVIDDLLIMAYYQDGIYAYDISNPSMPVLQGYFDTHPQNSPGTYPGPAYQGCWAVYTDLPSGILLASDMQLGLFVLDISQLTSIREKGVTEKISIYPNPAHTQLKVKLQDSKDAITQVQVTDMSGKLVLEKSSAGTITNQMYLNTENIPSGLYLVRIHTAKGSLAEKIRIHH